MTGKWLMWMMDLVLKCLFSENICSAIARIFCLKVVKRLTKKQAGIPTYVMKYPYYDKNGFEDLLYFFLDLFLNF
jgi:hypothetical protein